MNHYQKALKELSVLKAVEKAIIELEKKEQEDELYIHLNIELLNGTIEALSRLKGKLLLHQSKE